MRKIYDPHGWKEGDKLSVEDGGSGAGNAPEAVTDLELVGFSHVGEPNGPVLLDQNGVVEASQYPAGVLDPEAPSLTGVTRMFGLQTAKLKITNYDSDTAYVLSAVGGVLTQKGEDLFFVAGRVSEQGYVKVNNTTWPIWIDPVPIAAPVILSPLDGSINLLDHFTVVASAFSTTQADVQASADWQIATDPQFGSIVLQSMGDMLHLNSWPVTGMLPNTKYYLRARYNGAYYGPSEWSKTAAFSTLVRFVPNQPTIVSPADGTSSLGVTFKITGSAYVSLSGDVQAAADWQVATDPNFNYVVAQSLGDTVNKTSWTVSGLSYSSKYYIRVRYKGVIYGYGDWSVPAQVGTSGLILVTGDLQGAGGGGSGGVLDMLFATHIHGYSYGSYGGGAGQYIPVSIAATSRSTINVTIGAGGLGGYAPAFNPGWDYGGTGSNGDNSVIDKDGNVLYTATGGVHGSYMYSSATNGDHTVLDVAPGGPGQSSPYGAGGPYWPSVGYAPAGGIGAGGSGASSSATDPPAMYPYAVGGNGGPGYSTLKYPNTYPMPISYSGASYANTGGYHTFSFAQSGQLVFGGFEPTAPVIASPANGATGVDPLTIKIIASAYSSPVNLPQVSTDWQVATDPGFTNIVAQSLNDGNNLTSWSPGGLAYAASYYARVRYCDQSGAKSAWSNPVGFSMLVAFVFNPVLSGDVYNYYLHDQLVANGWNGVMPVRATVTIAGGAWVGSGGTGAYAFDTGYGYPAGSKLVLVNNSWIAGAGGMGGPHGNGGTGGNGGAGQGMVGAPGYGPGQGNNGGTPGGPGNPGGPALIVQYPTTVYNYGNIAGGGGGGGGSYTGGSSDMYSNVTQASDRWGPKPGSNNAGWGGSFGNYGQAGQTPDGMEGAGGPPGHAVVGNGNITWAVQGTILGPVA